MKKILAGVLSMIMLCSVFCGMIIAPSVAAAEGEPDKAAIVVFDKGFKNGFKVTKWGSPGTVKEDGGKLQVTIDTNGNEVYSGASTSAATYFSGADWAADGAVVLDANMTTTLESGSRFFAQLDVYRYESTDGSYSQKNPDNNNNAMSLKKDLYDKGQVTIKSDANSYDRVCIPLDKTAGEWSGSGNANLSDDNRYFRSLKFQVKNDGTNNDTVLIDKLAFAHTSPTSVDSIKYYTDAGIEIPASGSSLSLKPSSVKIKVKNYGLVDDSTLDGVTINGVNVEKSFDMDTNTITLNVINPDSIQLNQSYQVNVSGVKVYGGNSVEAMSSSFTVADSTSLESYKFYDYAGNIMNGLITTDLDKIELSFSNGAIDSSTISNFALYTAIGMTIPVEAALEDNKVTVTVKGDLDDNSKYTLTANGVKTTSGEAVVCANIPINTQNTIVLFDDEAKNGLVLGTRNNPIKDFKHEPTTEKNVSGDSGFSIHTFMDTTEDAKGQFQWKFDEDHRNWTEYYNGNWSFTYWMTADSYASSDFDGVSYNKIPYWHTAIIDNKWCAIPTSSGNAVRNYTCWLDSDMYNVNGDSWVYLALPLQEFTDAKTADWTKVAEIAGGPNKGNNVYVDEMKLVANTRIIPKSITLKSEDGSEINSVQGVAPGSIEVAFTGNLDRNTVKQGIAIEDSQGGTISYDYKVDYMKSVVTVTPKDGYKGGETYTVKVDGLAAFGGAPQKRTLEKAFTTPVASAKVKYYNGDTEAEAGGSFNKVIVNAAVAESVEAYTIYLGVYKDNRLEEVFLKRSTDDNPTELTAEFGKSVSSSEYEVRAFIWKPDMEPLL